MDETYEVSRFGHVELADMPEDIRARLAPIVEKSGFVPNVFRALARRPAELRAFLDYHDALMEPDPSPAGAEHPDLSSAGSEHPDLSSAGSKHSVGLSKAERELIVVATSAANDCTYCVVAHGAILRIRSKDPEKADRVAINPGGVALSARERAIVDLALVVAVDPASTTPGELEAARDAGLSDDEIWDIGAIAALFALSNRMAHLTGMQPNPEFFTMGRTGR